MDPRIDLNLGANPRGLFISCRTTLSTHLSRINLCRRGGQFGGTLRGLSTFRLTFVYGIRTEKVPESWNGGMFKDCEQVLSVPTRPRVERYQAPGISSVNIMNAVLEFADMCSELSWQAYCSAAGPKWMLANVPPLVTSLSRKCMGRWPWPRPWPRDVGNANLE